MFLVVVLMCFSLKKSELTSLLQNQSLELMTYIGYETGVKGWKFVQWNGAIFTGATATFDDTLFPCCPGAKTLARTDLGGTPDTEGHIPHGMPDGGLTSPGPSSENSSQDDSNNNHSNEGPDYPGDLDDKSPESSAPSTRPPLQSASPPWYPKKTGLPHPSEVRCDMDEWNRLPCRSGHERNITRHPGNMYGETCPPSEIERDPRVWLVLEKDSWPGSTEWILCATTAI